MAKRPLVCGPDDIPMDFKLTIDDFDYVGEYDYEDDGYPELCIARATVMVNQYPIVGVRLYFATTGFWVRLPDISYLPHRWGPLLKVTIGYRLGQHVQNLERIRCMKQDKQYPLRWGAPGSVKIEVGPVDNLRGGV